MQMLCGCCGGSSASEGRKFKVLSNWGSKLNVHDPNVSELKSRVRPKKHKYQRKMYICMLRHTYHSVETLSLYFPSLLRLSNKAWIDESFQVNIDQWELIVRSGFTNEDIIHHSDVIACPFGVVLVCDVTFLAHVYTDNIGCSEPSRQVSSFFQARGRRYRWKVERVFSLDKLGT